MTKRLIFISLLLLAVGVFSSACTKTVSEKVAEKNIENSMGQNADVDINNDNVSIKTDNGNWQAGNDLGVPDNWPSDVHLTEGSVTSVTNTDVGNSVTITSDKSVADLKTEYQNALTKDGWDITTTMDVGTNLIFSAKKDNRVVNISIGEEDNHTVVIIGVMTKEE